MKRPEVVIITRRRPVDVDVREPEPPPPESGVVPVPPRRWRDLSGEVAGEFRSHGARVWAKDEIKSARRERRIVT